MMNLYRNPTLVLTFFSFLLLYPLPLFSYFIPQKHYLLEKQIDSIKLSIEILLCQTHADCPPYFFCDTTFSPFLNYCRKQWPTQPLPIPVPVPPPHHPS
jgi:hypothetical protein